LCLEGQTNIYIVYKKNKCTLLSQIIFLLANVFYGKKNPMGLKAFSNNFYIQIVSTIFSPT